MACLVVSRWRKRASHSSAYNDTMSTREQQGWHFISISSVETASFRSSCKWRLRPDPLGCAVSFSPAEFGIIIIIIIIISMRKRRCLNDSSASRTTILSSSVDNGGALTDNARRAQVRLHCVGPCVSRTSAWPSSATRRSLRCFYCIVSRRTFCFIFADSFFKLDFNRVLS